ncbi:hypothetical protein BG003_001685, partial [Podila horticola]
MNADLIFSDVAKLSTTERKTHTILEYSIDAHGKVLIRIPTFFLHIYNETIDEVRNSLGSAFLHDWMENREWGFFEGFIAENEALRTNLLIGDGRQVATLGDIYQGALGRAETLGRTVKLKKLSVVKAARRFPESEGLTVGGREQKQYWEPDQKRDWRSDVVIKNADGAQFGDVCVYRESADGGDNALCRQGIKRARTITVLITTADIMDHEFEQLNESFPDNCLLIYGGNFTKFFGDTFSIPAAHAASKDLNWNFATRETLRKKHKLGDEEVDQILENMPYSSFDDLVQK